MVALQMRVALVLTVQAGDDRESGWRALTSHGGVAADVAALAVVTAIAQGPVVAPNVAMAVGLRLVACVLP